MSTSFIELEVFDTCAKMPDGLRFKEWSPGNTVAHVINKDGSSTDTLLVAIERISDGKFASFEIISLKNEDGKLEPGLLYVSAAVLANAVDQAIAELET
jgi:hypothetical protein